MNKLLTQDHLRDLSVWGILAGGRCIIERLDFEEICWYAVKVRHLNQWSIFYETVRTVQIESNDFEAVIGLGRIVKDKDIIRTLVLCNNELFSLYRYEPYIVASQFNLRQDEIQADCNNRWNQWQVDAFDKDPRNQ